MNQEVHDILKAALTNVDILIYVISLAGTVASLFAATQTGKTVQQWWVAQKATNYGKALSFLEAGVTQVYHTVYKELKADIDHKITPAEALRLRTLAIRKAIEFSEQELGRDIVTKQIGYTRLDSTVENLVGALKKANTGPNKSGATD